jgi:hypothetical protein
MLCSLRVPLFLSATGNLRLQCRLALESFVADVLHELPSWPLPARASDGAPQRDTGEFLGKKDTPLKTRADDMAEVERKELS